MGMDTTTSTAAAGSLTRGEVAKTLGISVAGVRRREGKTLHPTQGEKGEWLFFSAEVEAERQRLAADTEPAGPPDAGLSAPPAGQEIHAAEEMPASLATETGPRAAAPRLAMVTTSPTPAEDGAIAAQVFRLFSEGRSPVEAVIETKLAPPVVEALYADWQRLESLDVSSTGARAHVMELAAAVQHLESQVEARRQQTVTQADDIADLATRLGAIEGALVRLGLCRMADRDGGSTEDAPTEAEA